MGRAVEIIDYGTRELTPPLVTIGLTAFNSADTIERALRSALTQTWRPIEVVAVDDCSTDGTRDILDRLAGQYSELRVFGNAVNGGVAVSRNRILTEARGEFVAFFDDDDESLPERIALQWARIVDYEREFASGARVICHTARRLVYPQGRARIASTMGQNQGRPAPAGPAVARRILLGAHLEDGYGACPTSSQMARLSTYRALGGFDPTLRRGEDTDLNIRLAEAGGHFVGIGRPLVVQTMTRTSEKSLAEEYRNMLLLMEKHRTIMDREGQYAFCRRWIDAKQAWLEGRRMAFALSLSSLAVRHPILTARRLVLALPNIGLNRDFSRFHLPHNSSVKS
jgi:glycosyltransferase involved in cell wall biosynthesis